MLSDALVRQPSSHPLRKANCRLVRLRRSTSCVAVAGRAPARALVPLLALVRARARGQVHSRALALEFAPARALVA